MNESKYIKQTLNMYNALLDLKEQIDSSNLKEHGVKKFMNGRVKSMEHNWGKHVEAKCILGSAIDLKFKNVLKELKSKLNSNDISKVTFELEKKDIIMLANSMGRVELNAEKIENILATDLSRTVQKLDCLRIEIETDVKSVKKDIERIIEDYPETHIVKKLADNFKYECERIQIKFNRMLDGIDIFLEIKNNNL